MKCSVPVVFVNGDWDIYTPMQNQHPKVMRQLMDILKTGAMEGLPDRIEFEPRFEFDPPRFKLPEAE